MQKKQIANISLINLIHSALLTIDYLSRLERRMRNLQDHIRPGNMQTQQQTQKTVENVVGREHGQNSWRLHGTAEDDARIEAKPRNDPNDGEESEYAVAGFLVVGVLG